MPEGVHRRVADPAAVPPGAADGGIVAGLMDLLDEQLWDSSTVAHRA